MKAVTMKTLAVSLPYLLVIFGASLGSSVGWAFDHSHKTWDTLVKKHVVIQGATGQFDYQALKGDRAAFIAYLNSLSAVTEKEFNAWTKDQRMAFLINAYNAFTVKLIVDKYPVKSIKKIGGFFSNPWKMKFFKLFGQKRYLDWIEHDVLRKKYKEPRVHFAVNCASIGCPMLAAQAFTAKNLNSLLDQQTKLFLRDKNRNSINPKEGVIYLSKIFDWFRKDFGNVPKFVAPYMTEPGTLRKQVVAGKYKVKFTTYDWNLNDVKSIPSKSN